MQVTIDSRDTRSIRAIEIASQAGQWLRCHSSDGQRKAYGIRSSRDTGRVYFVTQTSCTCQDFARRGLACKHMLSLRLYCELAKAQTARARAPRPRRYG